MVVDIFSLISPKVMTVVSEKGKRLRLGKFMLRVGERRLCGAGSVTPSATKTDDSSAPRSYRTPSFYLILLFIVNITQLR